MDPKTPTKPVLFTAPEELAIGMVAGVISRAFVTPLSNVTVRKQTSATSVSKDKESAAVGEDNDDDEGDFGNGPSSMAIAREIVDEKGWTGLWSGFKSACILVIPIAPERAPKLTLDIVDHQSIHQHVWLRTLEACGVAQSPSGETYGR